MKLGILRPKDSPPRSAAFALFLATVFLVAANIVLACGSSVRPPEPAVTIVDAGPRPATLIGADATDASAARPVLLKYHGVNLSGAEFGACCPGTLGRDYGWPTKQDVDAIAARRMNIIRLPFRHARLQPTLQGALNDAEFARMNEVVTYALSKGLTVMLEPHDSARHNGTIVTEMQFGDFWGRIARSFLTTPSVWFNLTNEPRDMPTETWAALATSALREIRRVGATNMVFVPGNGWTGAAHWTSNWYGTSNATAMLPVGKGDANTAYEVHLYLDSDGSGGGSECVSASIGEERIKAFVGWLKANGRSAFLGEIGAPDTALCKEAVTRTLAAVEKEPTYWWGWTWWSAGYRWPATYKLSLQPIFTDAGIIEKPQVEWLRPFLYQPPPQPPAPVPPAPAPPCAGCVCVPADSGATKL